MTGSQIFMGAAEVDITPESPMQLVGMGRVFVAHDGETFEYRERDHPATEPHDPLMLQATCLRQGDKKIILLTADLLYTVALEEVRAAVATACGISEDAVFYAATHNHNGPSGKAEYVDFLCERAARCATQAIAEARPVVAEHARGEFDRLSHDRAEPWGEVDGSVDVVRFTERDTGKLVTMWWNYGCHPCSLSWDFNEYSSDYPGIIREKVAEVGGEAVPISFMLGCAGNVQPMGLKRFSDPPNMYFGVPKGDFEMVERMGECIAEAGLSALEDHARPVDLGELNVDHYTVDLPIRVLHDMDVMRETRKAFTQIVAPVIHEGDPTTDLLEDASKLLVKWVDEIIAQGDAENKTRTIAGGTISLGELGIVFTPLEVAWQIGSRIREQSPFPVTLISTTSLGFESYLTEKKFYELDQELRPYETYGLQSMAGFSYTPESPLVFENTVLSQLEKSWNEEK